ncbi:Cysteine-rich protein 2-binding protein [Trichoplax sp. H2]|nr:Cysteine-rich protein 2-binding protein [Trichoplax sp. H2]|eukprot:RDD46260.1 Cysteine-rich protein 2-binding protein [Trichoplax sp. H2]
MSNSKPGSSCYCGEEISLERAHQNSLRCKVCVSWFHLACLKDKPPTDLDNDIFFELICRNCDPDGVEKFIRLPMNWLQVVHLTVYNLSRAGNSRHGYFRWREDICGFINKHWDTLMAHRKRTASWHSTVAGVLSLNCPQKFISGTREFNEPGWWTLANKEPPTIDVDSLDAMSNSLQNKKRRNSTVSSSDDGLELRPRKIRKSDQLNSSNNLNHHADEKMEETVDFSNVSSSQNEKWLNERDITVDETLPETIMAEEDPGTNDESNSQRTNSLMSTNTRQPAGKTVKSQNSSLDMRKPKLTSLRPHEERKLLKSLSIYLPLVKENPKLCRIYNKLLLRQVKRDKGLPVFDLDSCMLNYACNVNRCSTTADCDTIVSVPDVKPFRLKQKRNGGTSWNELISNDPSIGISSTNTVKSNILDRFQVKKHQKAFHQVKPQSFLQYLVGSNYESSTHSICSPYTARVLKPFIWRDYSSTPLKLQLLQEITSYHHKRNQDQNSSDSNSIFTPAPIDYCYVRPHHIPIVNSLCREFFWPGIDLSECLEYPDFSVVALYRDLRFSFAFRRLIVGFAFMTPDVKYHEAYVSFIFVHPDWRRAGIATFMLYHLVQTCMGKDVTLHVSTSNPAMLMYQKFGFKPDEFILDFYDKYLPEDSTDCRHAFFLRLKR